MIDGFVDAVTNLSLGARSKFYRWPANECAWLVRQGIVLLRWRIGFTRMKLPNRRIVGGGAQSASLIKMARRLSFAGSSTLILAGARLNESCLAPLPRDAHSSK